MSDEEVTFVQRPGGTGAPTAGIPQKAEKRQLVTVRLIGGPHHDQRVDVWGDLKRIKLPVIRENRDDPPPPEQHERVDPRTGTLLIDTKRTAVEAAAVYAVYTRRDRRAKSARFTDYEEED